MRMPPEHCGKRLPADAFSGVFHILQKMQHLLLFPAKVVCFTVIGRLSADNFLCIFAIRHLAQILKNYSGFRFLASEIDTPVCILYNTC